MTDDMDSGRPVSAQFPLSAAWKNGEANQRTSLCALSSSSSSGSISAPERMEGRKTAHAPERRTLDDDFDRPGELGLLRECLVNVNGLLRVGDAQLGNRVFRVCAFEEPRWRASRGAEYARRSGVCLCW